MNVIHPSLMRFRLRVLVIAVAVVMACSTLASVLVARHQYVALPPELAAKHINVGMLLAREVRRAVELGIPLAELRGLGDLFKDARAANPEISFIRFTTAGGAAPTADGLLPADLMQLDGLPVTQPGQPPNLGRLDGFSVIALPVGLDDGTVIGRLAIGVAGDYVARLIGDRLFDIVTVQIVTAIITVELLLLFMDHAVTGPMLGLQVWAQAVRERRVPPALQWRVGNELGRFVDRLHLLAGSMGWTLRERRGAGLPWPVILRYIRVSLFLFVLADTLSLSFLPIFAQEVYEPLWGLDRDLLLGLPVVTYWLTSAVVQLPGAQLLDRFIHRTVFTVGAVLAAGGAVASALSETLPALLAARALSGVGLGLVFMVCQAAILTHVPHERRAYGIATFTGVFFLATFCGTALGGVVAEEVGFRGTFVASALAALGAAAFAYLALGSSRENRRAQAVLPQVTFRDYLPLLRNPRFTALLLLSALPNRVFNVALLFYLAPLYLFTLGNSKAEIGRIIAVYGLTMAFAAPLLVRFVDRRGWHLGSVIFGSLLCAAGALALLPLSNTWGIVIAIIAMGVGQALNIPSQMTLVPEIGAGQEEQLGVPRIYAVFRVGERVPAFLGPILGGLLVSVFGYASAIASYGVWLAASSLAMMAVFRFTSKPSGATP